MNLPIIINPKIQHYIDLITVLTKKEIKVRYKSTFLGYLWSIGYPLAFASVLFIAFRVVMKIQMENYGLFLISGLFPWQWFANSVNASPMILLGNASIIKKVNFPRNIIPFTQVLQDMIHFILSIPVIILFLLLHHKFPSPSWLYGFPILLASHFLITYGISLSIASVNLFFRDLERLTAIFTTLLFYFTPIFYPESMVPEKYKYLLSFNPVSPIIISWRSLFLEGRINPSQVSLSFLYAVIFCITGHIIYRTLSWKFAEVL